MGYLTIARWGPEIYGAMMPIQVLTYEYNDVYVYICTHTCVYMYMFIRTYSNMYIWDTLLLLVGGRRCMG
jgi:hypothetical protein